MSHTPLTISQPQGFSELGQKPNQEDALYPALGHASHTTHAFVVCDGMGGHAHGEVASNCVAQAIGQHTRQAEPCTIQQMKQHFEEGLTEAYHQLNTLDSEQHDSAKGTMGTTLTFLAICTDGILLAHIGDSRIYQFRPGKGVVYQTRDHSLVNDLIAAGELTEAEARTCPQRNVITKAVQPHQQNRTKPTFKVIPYSDVEVGDVFMLCCDGIVEQLDNNNLQQILLAEQPFDKRIEALKQACHSRGTHDNHSCWAFDVEKVEHTKLQPAPQPDAVEELFTHDAHSTNQSSAPTKHTWLLAVMLAFIILLCFGAGYFLWHKPRQATNIPAAAIPQKVEQKVEQTATPADSNDTNATQGTITRHHK